MEVDKLIHEITGVAHRSGDILGAMTIPQLQQEWTSAVEILGELGKGTEREHPGLGNTIHWFEVDQANLSSEIRRRENGFQQDAEHARTHGVQITQPRNGAGKGYETAGAFLTKDQSVRSYMQDHNLIRQQEFEALSFGAMMRAAVTGPRTEIEKRALAEGTDSAGGYTVPDIVLARFIDKMRAATTVIRAGAKTVPLTSDKTSIARRATDPTATWRNENAAITVADGTFESVIFVPRSLAVIVKCSRELLEDSLNIEQMLEASFAGSMAVELDRVALIGSGTAPEPRGISNTTNVGSVASGGALTSFDKIIDGMYECWVDNSPTVSALIMPPRTYAALAKLKEATTNAPLAMPSVLQGIPFMQTSSLPVNETPGTASRIILGDFSQLMIGVRTSLRVEVLRELYAGDHQYGFVAHLRADIGLEHPESFAMVTGIVP